MPLNAVHNTSPMTQKDVERIGKCARTVACVNPPTHYALVESDVWVASCDMHNSRHIRQGPGDYGL